MWLLMTFARLSVNARKRIVASLAVAAERLVADPAGISPTWLARDSRCIAIAIENRFLATMCDHRHTLFVSRDIKDSYLWQTN